MTKSSTPAAAATALETGQPARASEAVPVRSVAMRDVHQALRRLILEFQSSAPGSEVSQTELSQRLNCSRTPLREALRLLEREGLVESNEAYGRVRISSLSMVDVDDLYSLRVLGEGLAVWLTVPSLRSEDFETLERDLELAAKGDGEAHARFHRILRSGATPGSPSISSLVVRARPALPARVCRTRGRVGLGSEAPRAPRHPKPASSATAKRRELCSSITSPTCHPADDDRTPCAVCAHRSRCDGEGGQACLTGSAHGSDGDDAPVYKCAFGITYKRSEPREAMEEYSALGSCTPGAGRPGLVKYVQSVAVETLGGAPFDGLAELYFESRQAYDEAMASEYWQFRCRRRRATVSRDGGDVRRDSEGRPAPLSRREP